MEYLPLMGKSQYRSHQRKPTHTHMTETTNPQWLYILLEETDNFRFSLGDMASKVMCQLTWDDPSLSAYCTKSVWGLLTQMPPAGPITNLLTPLWHLTLVLNPMEARISGDDEASSVIGMMVLVGIFTVAGPLNCFLVSMIRHPEWLARCQKEMDEVCNGRMPTLDDSPNLPVLRACIKKTMRWKPNDFLRNPTKYPDPENYRPEHWIEPGWPTCQGPLKKYPNVKGMISIDPATGLEIDIPLNKPNSLLVVKPDPFQMVFESRSATRKTDIIK
ncbi:cytochrome P450 [Cenococcum geophilum 1.58]|uniref:cytochrome P450 n=1 Tax=Cenococcum geophilum 1.58 TaxID=794803 RepID=UPI00358EAEB4|nr:cytochrome P450 [Cenococcum geophilum 1.58]